MWQTVYYLPHFVNYTPLWKATQPYKKVRKKNNIDVLHVYTNFIRSFWIIFFFILTLVGKIRNVHCCYRFWRIERKIHSFFFVWPSRVVLRLNKWTQQKYSWMFEAMLARNSICCLKVDPISETIKFNQTDGKWIGDLNRCVTAYNLISFYDHNFVWLNLKFVIIDLVKFSCNEKSKNDFVECDLILDSVGILPGKKKWRKFVSECERH